MNYENVDLHGKRLEPITVSAIYAFFPDRCWTPVVELGVGGARASRVPDSKSNETSLAAKAAVRAALYHAGHPSAVRPTRAPFS